MQTYHPPLYLLVLAFSVFIVVSALGGGLFDQSGYWQLQWQHQIFSNLCHQNPARSFWINGQPMAVCSRCIGIYTGFSLSWLMLPAVSRLGLRLSPLKKVLLAIILINFLDIVGNILGFWQNTLDSRLVLGWIMGWTAVLLFSGDFFKSKYKSKKDHYGRVTTTGIGK